MVDRAKNGVPVMNDIRLHGLHHVTAIASDPQRNVDFYTRVLGLRLVKQTVNFDAPDTYHLYYGDQQGPPVHAPDLLPVAGRAEGQAGHGADHGDRVQCPSGVAGLVAAATGRPGRGCREALRSRRRGGADPPRPGRTGDRSGRLARRYPWPACRPSTRCAGCTR